MHGVATGTPEWYRLTGVIVERCLANNAWHISLTIRTALTYSQYSMDQILPTVTEPVSII